MRAKKDNNDFPKADFNVEPPQDESVNDAEANDDAVQDDGAAVNDAVAQFAESAVPDEDAQRRYEPLVQVPYIDPVKLTEVVNAEAADAPKDVSDPNGPVVSHSWSGLQTHDFGGIPYTRAAVVTVDEAKEKLLMRQATEGR
jgi:hypothetical protein